MTPSLEQLSKRPKRQFTRKAKVAGELRAGSLADLQPEKSHDWRDHFSKRPWSKHEHQWLFGTDNAVCSLCGHSVPKAQATHSP